MAKSNTMANLSFVCITLLITGAYSFIGSSFGGNGLINRAKISSKTALNMAYTSGPRRPRTKSPHSLLRATMEVNGLIDEHKVSSILGNFSVGELLVGF